LKGFWQNMANETNFTFNRDFAPPYGLAERLSPLITRIVCDNPGPFTFRGTATYLVGRDSLIIVDPGPDNDSHFQSLCAAIGERPVSCILITHTHLDHSRMARRLKAHTGARTAAFGPHGSGRRKAVAGTSPEAGADRDFVPDIRLVDGDVVASPEATVRAVFTPGHTSNHMAYAVEEEKTLLTGDHVMSWATSVIAPPDGHMGDYLASLRKLLERDDELYLPAHGPPVPNPHALVRAYIAHRRMRRAAILKRLGKGPQSVAALVEGIYAGLDPALIAAARQSTLAQLDQLMEEGLVGSETGESESCYFLTAGSPRRC
jgi:glyoxylase-like metal-dependent hydrolase (beta-lactamase superfamily II)